MQTEENQVLYQYNKYYDEVRVQLHTFLLINTYSQVFPVYLSRSSCRHEFKYTSIVHKTLMIAFILIEEEVAIMLILEGDKGMANEMGQIEQERVVLSILIVKHYSTIVNEFNFLRKSRKAVFLAMSWCRLFNQSCPLLLLLLMLIYQCSPCIVNYFQPIKVIA